MPNFFLVRLSMISMWFFDGKAFEVVYLVKSGLGPGFFLRWISSS